MLNAIVRLDGVMDELCAHSVEKECKKWRNKELKNSYVIKGYGKGRGT